ncbi:hypothetical protein L596_016776 [Steinernema carpocapsae]|uniref:Origin recognition complex subunit 1 n=1 Tax=Steinernema carpocapsae TaxID=34508 RepID=A0A4U5NIZ4_STECR|nr:hypothetical protein L596_016776 [Steinernema carpocapsae]
MVIGWYDCLNHFRAIFDSEFRVIPDAAQQILEIDFRKGSLREIPREDTPPKSRSRGRHKKPEPSLESAVKALHLSPEEEAAVSGPSGSRTSARRNILPAEDKENAPEASVLKMRLKKTTAEKWRSPDQKNRRVTRNLAAKNPGRGVSSGGVTKTSPKAARALRMTPAKAEFAKFQAKTPHERPMKTPQSLESAVKAMKVSDNEEEAAAAPKSAHRSLFQEKKTEETPGKLDLKVLKKRTSKQWGIAGPNSPFGAIKEPSTTGRKSMRLKIDGDEDYNLSGESEQEEKLEIEESEDEDFVRSKSRTRKTPQKMQRRASRSRKPANDDGVLPTKKARQESVKPKPNTLEWVRSQLCAALIPDRLPCRDQEYRHIEVFFKKAIAKNGESQSMYISGVPGTGKTATVLQVARMYEEQKSSPKFHFIHVNAMELSDPKMFFAAVFKQYAGKDASAKVGDDCTPNPKRHASLRGQDEASHRSPC